MIQLLYNANGFTQYPGSPKYTTAHLETDGKFAAGPYGKLEARIKTAYAPGIGQAFWAMGNDHLTSAVPWPWCGELDIMEITYPTPGHNGWTLHADRTARLSWPIYPFNPYANGPETALTHAVGALSIPLNLQEGSSWFRTQDISFTLEAS